MIENKLKISGTYGDRVKLHLDGYVNTKYGKMLKIKSVDIEGKCISFYGGEKLDFSRISSSYKDNEESFELYKSELISKLFRLGIKSRSIIKYEDSEFIIAKISIIDYCIVFESDSKLKLVITDFDNLQKIEVLFTPYTLSEKLSNLLSKHSNFGDKIMDRDEYLKQLEEFIKEVKSTDLL